MRRKKATTPAAIAAAAHEHVVILHTIGLTVDDITPDSPGPSKQHMSESLLDIGTHITESVDDIDTVEYLKMVGVEDLERITTVVEKHHSVVRYNIIDRMKHVIEDIKDTKRPGLRACTSYNTRLKALQRVSTTSV